MAKIFILGFMGCGKSYVGKQLSQRIGIDFVDLDALIVDMEGRSIPQIFEKNGESFFRNLESKALKSLTSSTNQIIAVGGGTPCFFDNMDWINQHGVSIFINTNPEVLAKRLKNETNQRPLVQNLPPNDLLPYIEIKLAERTSFYEQAHLIYTVQTGKEPIVEELANFLNPIAQLNVFV